MTSFFQQKSSVSKWILHQVNKPAYLSVTITSQPELSLRDWRHSRHQFFSEGFFYLKWLAN